MFQPFGVYCKRFLGTIRALKALVFSAEVQPIAADFYRHMASRCLGGGLPPPPRAGAKPRD